MAGRTVKANGKLNLTLDVLGRRADGYHDLRMVMQTVELADRLTIAIQTGRELQVSSDLGFLPNNAKNLAAVAALQFEKATGRDLGGFSVEIQKAIPVCAGMGGGSADAAAVLCALNEMTGAGLTPLELAHLGEQVGSDVPYCVLGGTVLAEGKGERLTHLPALPACWVVLCKPGFSISTPELFSRMDGIKIRHRPDTVGVLAALESKNLEDVARRMYNVFEPVLPVRQRKDVQEIKNLLLQHGALGASMSGTGPTVFGLYSEKRTARMAYQNLKSLYRYVFLTKTV
ncbi:MAG: 4-(cytidine 5'-diphospho)-2-C-methyl-D-erythritol kinase [Intestinimonas sp.]|jgi:4-diphosphocytidyl-2-C-methyl-D-erythritol kinase|nr:4-(cytidine 5'-diphospho)-2-C-methyl-D-erythritol kinase [Intestinimonas sp.]